MAMTRATQRQRSTKVFALERGGSEVKDGLDSSGGSSRTFFHEDEAFIKVEVLSRVILIQGEKLGQISCIAWDCSHGN